MVDAVDRTTENLQLRKDIEALLRFRREHPDLPLITLGEGMTDREFAESSKSPMRPSRTRLPK